MTTENGWQMQIGLDGRLQGAVGRAEQRTSPSIREASELTSREICRADWIRNRAR